MHGPMPPGHWTRGLAPRDDRELVRGHRYRVVRRFLDFDGAEHDAGETWVFLGSNFSPHDDGVSWFVSLDGQREWHIRMRWTPEDQGRVLDALDRYFVRLRTSA